MAKVKHIVLLEFKTGTSGEQIAGFFRSLAGLRRRAALTGGDGASLGTAPSPV